MGQDRLEEAGFQRPFQPCSIKSAGDAFRTRPAVICRALMEAGCLPERAVVEAQEDLYDFDVRWAQIKETCGASMGCAKRPLKHMVSSRVSAAVSEGGSRLSVLATLLI